MLCTGGAKPANSSRAGRGAGTLRSIHATCCTPASARYGRETWDLDPRRPPRPMATASGWRSKLSTREKWSVRSVRTTLGLIPDPDAVRAVWEDAAAAPDWTGPALWLHGDLHPANVLTADGTICGVIDFGDLCAGDPACDLAAPWVLLPDGAVDRFYEAYRPTPDAATLRRARGWAVLRALACIHIGDAGIHGRPGGKPTWGPPAHATLRRLTAASRP
ncbi:phosphotransferase [Streptomyces sp. NPDC088747]|uniref:phosphotransferase n=1 Tax=Streptomyces sp. NPDC088747 TaxID=3365886 RepID=UPI0037F62A5A